MDTTPQAQRYWVLTHEHRHGMSQTIFTHPTEPDMAVIIAYAKRTLDYEDDRDDEFLTLTEGDPFQTYADIASAARKEP